MSIFTGKKGYESTAAWQARSREALKERGRLYNYDYGYDPADATVPWVTEQLAKLPPKPDILEIGSGFGKWATALDGIYNTFTGAEIVKERVEHARATRLQPNRAFVHIPMPDWDLGRTFDVVMVITVIQHVPVPRAVEIMQAISRHMGQHSVALLAEGRLWDITVEEAERRYEESSCAEHMIPKPISLLKDAAPSLDWEILGGGKFLLRKKHPVTEG